MTLETVDTRFGEKTRQAMVGLAKLLYDEGYTTQEIATKLCVSESTVRSIKKVIDEAKANGMK